MEEARSGRESAVREDLERIWQNLKEEAVPHCSSAEQSINKIHDSLKAITSNPSLANQHINTLEELTKKLDEIKSKLTGLKETLSMDMPNDKRLSQLLSELDQKIQRVQLLLWPNFQEDFEKFVSLELFESLKVKGP